MSWTMWAVTAAAAFGLAAWLYRYREPPGRGRGLLVALRGSVLALLLLLLFDPSVSAPARGPDDHRLLLDASASMAVQAAGMSASPWEEAVARARSAGVRDVLLVGDVPRLVSASALDRVAPDAPRSRLLPALQAAAQSGARRVTFISDGRLDDADEVRRWLPRLGLALELDGVGGGIDNAAVTRARAQPWAETGRVVEVSFDLMAVGAGPDSLVVRIMREGDEVGHATVARPGPGRVASATVGVATDPAESGHVRYAVALDAGDADARDDVRHVYVRVSSQPAGVVIASFRPDWETRFLFPVLERALGLPVRGFLATGDGWVEQGPASRAGREAGNAEVLAAVERAELVVLHGADASAPSPVLDAAAAAPALLLLPRESGRLAGVPIVLPPAVPGDWYLSGQVPSSPVARALAGMETDVPPLTALRIADDLPGTWAAANVSRGRRGAAYPLLLGGLDGTRRWVVAPAQGYWTWALRGGEARATYERLWSAVGGWLVTSAASERGVEPVSRVIERGAPVLWLAAADSVRLRLADPAGAAVMDTIVRPDAADTAATPPLQPGRYRYVASAFRGPDTLRTTGEITVESATTEAVRPAALAALSLPLAELGDTGERDGGRPLHASAWPYVAIVLLLCTEWILRRRWGLR